MKKYFALLMTLLLAAAAPLAALAEDTTLIPFEGLVTEVFDGGFLMEDKHMGYLQVNTGDETVFDGLLSIQPVEVGMYVIVDHNGMVTRSLPPQVYGLRVGCYTLNGTVSEIAEDGVLITGDPIFGDAFVQMTPTMANVFPGTPILVYYDGVMTMSLPGKVNARHVVVPEVTGMVSEKDGAGFTLTDEDGNTYRVLTSDSLLVGQLLGQLMDKEEETIAEEPVEETAEGAVTESSEEAVMENGEEAGETAGDATSETADETGAESTDDASSETVDAAAAPPADGLLLDETIPTGNEDGAEVAPAIQWGNGDIVTVYHQGPLQAQPGSDLLALGLLVHR